MKRIISVSMVVIFTVIVLSYIQVHNFVPVQTQENVIMQDSCSDIVEKDRDSRTESLEVNESTPDSAVEMTDRADSYVLSEEEKKVLLAYAKYLQNFYEEYPYETDGIKYDLVFIDIDNIPELAIIPSAAHASWVTICVYNDGNVVEAGGFGSFGKCRFNPYENLIFSTYMGQGEEESFFYRIEGTESVELLALHSTPQYEGFQYIGESYEVNGTEVAEAVYKQTCEEWDWEKLNVWGYDDAVFVNDIDDMYRELRKRFSFVKEQSRMEQEDSCLEEWKQAYLNYLDSLDNYADVCTYSLIYVDDDDIPEMVVDTGFEAGGCQFLTFHNYVLDVWQSARLNVAYIERGNLICNSDGNMGYYYDDVYSIQDGKWVYVGGGIHGDGPNGVQLDENGNYIEFFYWEGEEYWNGEEITKEEYETRLNTIYPMEQSMYPQKYYVLDDIKAVLRTGNAASVEHRYEFVVSDVTWEEARKLCEEKGGYLATITSQEEFKWLQEQMISEDKTSITFFVGASDSWEDGFGYHWLEPGTESGYGMIELSSVFREFWQEGEPSYRSWTESGVEVDEDCVVLIYQESNGQCYLNDVSNDILETIPSYAGKVGYICEYE